MQCSTAGSEALLKADNDVEGLNTIKLAQL